MSGVCTEQDDEFSIVMIAFHEAIQSYSRTRGSFLHYASILIKNRLIDYHRKESRHQGHLSLHEKIDDDGTELHEHIAYEVDHYEETGVPVNTVAAAMILADKSDVRRSRVRNIDISKFDIHDRVNYSVKKSVLKINEEKTIVKLKLTVDTKFGSVMDYFEIFMTRMVLCRKAAEKLGLQFKLIINEQQLI